MSNRQNSTKSVGSIIGEAIREVCYFLAILFCVLRACDVINWGWFWIMFPIFASWAAGIILLAVAGIIAFAAIEEAKSCE